MANDNSDLTGKSILRGEATLTRLADMMAVPVEVFTDGADAPLDVAGASELLTLWCEMDSDADRERLLVLARTLARA